MEMQQKSGKLAPKAERYCQLRAMGSAPYEAMQRAGYKIDPNASLAVITKKANQYDRAPYIQERIAEIKNDNSLLEADTKNLLHPDAFKHLALDKDDMSIGWINAAAFTVYQQTLAAENFHQSLQVLKFMAELNGFGANLTKPGRPKHDNKPNDNQTSHNHDVNTDAGTPAEDASFADFFADDDGSDGEEPADEDAA